jgi:hypothetical protein
VHSSEKPELWNMTKNLVTAFGIASVGILGSVLLLYFASLDQLDWWPSSAQLERTGKPGITPGQVSGNSGLVGLGIGFTFVLGLSTGGQNLRTVGVWWTAGDNSGQGREFIVLVECFLIKVLLLCFGSLNKLDWQPSSALLESTGKPEIAPGQVSGNFLSWSVCLSGW